MMANHMMGMRWIVRKKLAAALAALAITAGVLFPPARAEAIDAWGIAAQALGVLGAYHSSLSAVLAIGNDVNAQVQSRRQDLAENGRARNARDIALIDGIMERLVRDGDYVLRANSLPFTWAVNDSAIFNAACYPTDYVSINRGLIQGLNGNVDELAAVLGHEMTHGIRQHSAHNYAKAAAQFYGLSFLNMNMGLMDWNKLNALVGYSIAKNVTLPTEYEADEGGFHIMTSAGFNPGGGAAAMARMGYYLTYVTQDLAEYQDPTQKDLPQDDFSDHPATERREAKLAGFMTDYSAGHVTVADRKTVCIDGTPLFTATWTDEDYEEFNKRTHALVEQYNAYTPVGLDPEKFRVNGELTLGENIGDLAGLSIAIEAYKIALEQQGINSLEDAPVLDGMSAAQRLLWSTAQGWRTKSRPQHAEMMISVDPHSPDEFRVNGTVRNIDEFYTALGVAEGDQLYLPPEERVRIWL